MAAGYETPMIDQFLAVNSGLDRRFGFKIVFPDYDALTLTTIFKGRIAGFLGTSKPNRWSNYATHTLQHAIQLSRDPKYKADCETIFDKQAGDITNLSEDAMQYTSSYQHGPEMLDQTDMEHLLRSYILKHKLELRSKLKESGSMINKLLKESSDMAVASADEWTVDGIPMDLSMSN
jgi:hypothetical protein